jgi:response regulator of citrate/malate metabolism
MIRTLVVEDDRVLAAAHRGYVERVPGFEAVGVVHSGEDALRFVAASAVDLILLDFYLPDRSGLDVCRSLRASGAPVDIIAVTSARELAVVRSAVAFGVAQYLLKPFTFALFKEKLDAYAEYRRRTGGGEEVVDQDHVDQALAALHQRGVSRLPKGLASQTLGDIVTRLRATDDLSAANIAKLVGISPATARRYLDYLSSQRLVTRAPRYGGGGRPELLYRWTGPVDTEPASS